MAGQTTVLLLVLCLFSILYYCHAIEQQHQTEQQLYGYLRSAFPVQYIKSRQIRRSAVESNPNQAQVEAAILAQQPPMKREPSIERSIFHEWQQCEFSPMSCLLKRRRRSTKK